MSTRRKEIEELTDKEKKATLKGILIINSMEGPGQKGTVKAYLENYRKVYGGGVGYDMLAGHLRRKLERIGENLGEEVQSKAGATFMGRVKGMGETLRKKIESWTNKRKVWTEYRGGPK